MTLTLTAEAVRETGQVRLDLRAEWRRRWVRAALIAGTPPGSNIGFWRTRMGAMRGWNFRVGRRYRGPCVTALLHTSTLTRHAMAAVLADIDEMTAR